MIKVQPLASSSRGNAYLLTQDNAAPALLLEAGLPFKETQRRIWDQNLTLADIAGVLISHEHGDHAKSAIELMARGLDVYTSNGTGEAILEKRIAELGIGTVKLLNHRLHQVKAREQFKIGPSRFEWTVLPFETIHDAAEPFGYLISDGEDKLVYITDTAYVTAKFIGLTIVMIECNYDMDSLTAEGKTHPEVKTRVIKNHFGLDQVKRFFEANDLTKVREIWLMHLSDSHGDAAKFKKEIQRQTGAQVYVAKK